MVIMLMGEEVKTDHRVGKTTHRDEHRNNPAPHGRSAIFPEKWRDEETH